MMYYIDLMHPSLQICFAHFVVINILVIQIYINEFQFHRLKKTLNSFFWSKYEKKLSKSIFSIKITFISVSVVENICDE